MGVITDPKLDRIFEQLSLQYQQGFNVEEGDWWKRLAMEIPSSTRQNTYGWMADLPGMREWLGPRVANNLLTYAYTITNKKWESTIKVDRTDIDDDQVGIYGRYAQAMGKAVKKHPNDLIKALIQDTTSLCFDGLPFFDGAHPESKQEGAGAGSYDNLDAVAFSTANYEAARAKMMAFKGEDHKPLGIMPNLVVGPPQLEGVMRRTLNADLVVSGNGSETNVWKGSADLLIIPRLADQATTWYMFDTSQPLMPFVYQNREAPQFVARNRPDDPKVFDEDVYLFGVRARDNAGYALPFLGYKSIG